MAFGGVIMFPGGIERNKMGEMKGLTFPLYFHSAGKTYNTKRTYDNGRKHRMWIYIFEGWNIEAIGADSRSCNMGIVCKQWNVQKSIYQDLRIGNLYHSMGR